MKIEVEGFEDWRSAARRLLQSDVAPEGVSWAEPRNGQLALQFDEHASGESASSEANSETAVPPSPYQVSKAFVQLAETVSCHRDPGRWAYLYRVLWRMTRGERHLLEQAADADVAWLLRSEQAVRLDSQRMKAFVRFHRLGEGPDQHMVAWYRPEHRIVRRVAPFFIRRFGRMPWALLTPEESVYWNRQELQYGPGVPAATPPRRAELEALWKTYATVLFRTVPSDDDEARDEAVRHWVALPGGATLDALLEDAQRQVQDTIRKQRGFDTSAADYLPVRRDLSSLARAAKTCQGCPLHKRATQTVFGEGLPDADIVFVGEQPGDQEDAQGHPFVGAAGRFLEEAIQQAGIDRSRVYVTNAVKHFKWEGTPKRRVPKKPDLREQAACRPWLEAELTALKPKVVVCLGATAAQALLGRDFRITRQRGEVVSTEWAATTIATHHPSAILRLEAGPVRDRMREEFLADVKRAAAHLADLHPLAC